MEKVIAVVSGKGGVGKTTFTANAGLALKNLGNEVTVLDGDMSNSNLGLQLGFFQFPLGLQDALAGNIDLNRAVYSHPSGLRVVPSSVSLGYLRRSPNPRRLKRLLGGLSGVVLVDCPPGIGQDVQGIMGSCDDVIVITNPEIPAVTDALKAIQVARELGKEPLGIVLNRTGEGYELRPEEVGAMCGIRVLGSVPEDRAVKRSIFNRNPVLHEKPLSGSSVAFMEIAALLSGVEYNRPTMLRLRRLLRR
jgi:septum site-determining protein MinD